MVRCRDDRRGLEERTSLPITQDVVQRVLSLVVADYCVMQVDSGCSARVTHLSDDVASRHVLSRLHEVVPFQMRIHCPQTVPVIDGYHTAKSVV